MDGILNRSIERAIYLENKREIDLKVEAKVWWILSLKNDAADKMVKCWNGNSERRRRLKSSTQSENNHS